MKVVSTGAVQDENGTAAVVRDAQHGPAARWRRSRSRSTCAAQRAQVAVPQRRPGPRADAGARAAAAPGRGVRVGQRPGRPPPSGPRTVRAKVGEAPAVNARASRRSRVTRPRLEQDPVSGVAAVGFAANRSKVEQRKLVIFAVARKGGRVVAAGRGADQPPEAGQARPLHGLLHRQPARRADLGRGAADATRGREASMMTIQHESTRRSSAPALGRAGRAVRALRRAARARPALLPQLRAAPRRGAPAFMEVLEQRFRAQGGGAGAAAGSPRRRRAGSRRPVVAGAARRGARARARRSAC